MQRGLFAALLASAVVGGASAAGNPLIPEGEFFSDPAGRVGPDGTLWLFGSRDECTNWYCSTTNDAIGTRDLVTWDLRKGILASKGETDGVDGTDAVLFAPDAIFVDGKWRLFFCTPDKAYAEGIASADKPWGPFTGARRIDGCTQIDPSIYQDDDGQLYYTWGQFSMKMAKFKSDLSGYDASTFVDGVIDEANHNFHEGSQFFRRGGLCYLVFADISRRGRPTSIGYATAESPFGPYTYRGVIIDNYGCDPEVWNNHGSVVEFNGKWYVFYHRSTNGTVMFRKACVEPIEFDEDGLIAEVEMTANGAGAPLDPYAETEGRLAVVMSGHARIVTLPDRQERLGGIFAGDTATWRYFDFSAAPKALSIRVIPSLGGSIALVDGFGGEYGRVDVPAGDGRTPCTVTLRLARPLPARKGSITLAFAGDREGTDLFDLESFTFTAE